LGERAERALVPVTVTFGGVGVALTYRTLANRRRRRVEIGDESEHGERVGWVSDIEEVKPDEEFKRPDVPNNIDDPRWAEYHLREWSKELGKGAAGPGGTGIDL
jgi:hypothetical protein